MKRILVVAVLLVLVGCVHVPRTCVMRNPETGHEVILSKQPVYGGGWYGVGVAMSQRANQKDLIEAYKARGYKMVFETEAGL